MEKGKLTKAIRFLGHVHYIEDDKVYLEYNQDLSYEFKPHVNRNTLNNLIVKLTHLQFGEWDNKMYEEWNRLIDKGAMKYSNYKQWLITADCELSFEKFMEVI